MTSKCGVLASIARRQIVGLARQPDADEQDRNGAQNASA